VGSDGDRTGSAPRTAARYVDADGRPTEDPAAAVAGEVVHRDVHGRLQRTRFFLTSREMPSWIPVGEAAFLLWVLVALFAAWVVIGLLLT
jgi:hypothetical protein